MLTDFISKIIEIDGFKVCCIKNDNTITTNLEGGIFWEKWSAPIIELFYEPGTDMVDVGAHIGTTTLLMTRVLTAGNRVHSFEPVFHLFLSKTVEVNSLQDTVTVYPHAVGEKAGRMAGFMVDLTVLNNFGQFPMNVTHEYDPNKDKSYFEVVTLDQYRFPPVSFIKIDVEGLESAVICGAIQTLFDHRPTVLMELFCSSDSARHKINVEKDAEFCHNLASCCSILFKLEYILIPVKLLSDEVLFVHISKRDKIAQLLAFLPNINKTVDILPSTVSA